MTGKVKKVTATQYQIRLSDGGFLGPFPFYTSAVIFGLSYVGGGWTVELITGGA